MKIDMSAARRDPRPIIPFELSAFAASLFALGLALGTTLAVGMLFVIQVSQIQKCSNEMFRCSKSGVLSAL